MNRDELNKVLEDHRAWRLDKSGGNRANLSRANLSWAKLSGAKLSGADLSWANLSRADLSRAKLSGADLSGAKLSGADLSGADLSGADLSGADLSGADLSGADLSGAKLSRAKLSRAKLSRANLSGAKLPEILIPVVERLHQRMLDEITIDMGRWHTCGTTHCRAGGAIHLAGPAGYELERQLGPSVAGALITMASCPGLEQVPDFHASDAEALADIKRLAEAGM